MIRRGSEARRTVLRAVFGGMALGAGMLLLAGAAAFWAVDDRFWLLQAVAIGLPALRLLVAALAVIAFVRAGHVLGGVLVLTLVLSFVLPWAQGENEQVGEAAPESPSIVVVSFNANPGQASHRDADLEALLEAEAPHVIAMQEHLVRKREDTVFGTRLIAPLLRGRAYAISWPSAEYEDWTDLPIFSRLEARGPSEYPVGGGKRGPWESGGLVRQVYEWEGQPIAVYNVHLHSFGAVRPWQEGWRRALSISVWRTAFATYRNDFAMRASQARAVRAVLDAEPLPFIVCADLNSTPHHSVYAILTQGLLDAFRLAGRGWGATYPASVPFARIDYVVASPHWEVRRSVVVTPLSSDHRPVLAELRLRASAPHPAPGD